MRRTRFLAVAGSATGVTFLRPAMLLAGQPLGNPIVEPVANPQKLRVRLFAAQDVASVELSGEAPLQVISDSRTTSVTNQTFSAETPDAFVSSTLPIQCTAHVRNGSTLQRRYNGSFDIRASGNALLVVNTVDYEAYTASVLASESSPGWHPEALKAQAIAIRSYARHKASRRSALYDVTDDTSNQVYRGLDRSAPAFAVAAQATQFQLLYFRGEPVDIWYHAACGGHTADASEITGHGAPAYLRGSADVDASGRAYCGGSPYFLWRNELLNAGVARVFDKPNERVSSIAVADRWPDGRVRTLQATFESGVLGALDGHAFYAKSGAVLGYKVVPSALFDVTQQNSQSFELTGHGVGHGVGMCQWGAQGRALAGATAAEILQAYFAGTEVVQLTS